jgi:hypothetical protein
MHSTILDSKDERTLRNPCIMECSINRYNHYNFPNLFNNVLIEKKFMWCMCDVFLSMDINLC